MERMLVSDFVAEEGSVCESSIPEDKGRGKKLLWRFAAQFVAPVSPAEKIGPKPATQGFREAGKTSDRVGRDYGVLETPSSGLGFLILPVIGWNPTPRRQRHFSSLQAATLPASSFNRGNENR